MAVCTTLIPFDFISPELTPYLHVQLSINMCLNYVRIIKASMDGNVSQLKLRLGF